MPRSIRRSPTLGEHAAAALYRLAPRRRMSATAPTTRPCTPREEGAVAAPTAGLHFTPQLMEALAAKGIARHFVTLHVGAGTFLPVQGRRHRRTT